MQQSYLQTYKLSKHINDYVIMDTAATITQSTMQLVIWGVQNVFGRLGKKTDRFVPYTSAIQVCYDCDPRKGFSSYKREYSCYSIYSFLAHCIQNWRTLDRLARGAQ